MKSLRHANSRRCADVGNGDKTIEEHFMAGLKPGDVTWVKLLGTSWWPAQVMDENTVSRKIKPRKRISSAVLVRLYGSYKYVYVDPMKSLSEFENILKQHNGSYREIIRKSLKRDLSKSEPGISKTQPSNSKSIGKIEVDALRKELKQSGAEEKAVLEVPISELIPEKSGDLGARRLKVMQGLGLIAPPGSPFCKNGYT
ncbi:hypothetical protein Nepgr_019236 [Nepenthes gracilis]|uniref:PWWP domain-containing protein n=1 Tax=Nepenthes gracilis TaxID=150966 RepID=A0AAD3SUT0_NEPGR|nr:hypothetical protein Nepgr_019236 [Nepenthes gracilis]